MFRGIYRCLALLEQSVRAGFPVCWLFQIYPPAFTSSFTLSRLTVQMKRPLPLAPKSTFSSGRSFPLFLCSDLMCKWSFPIEKLELFGSCSLSWPGWWSIHLYRHCGISRVFPAAVGRWPCLSLPTLWQWVQNTPTGCRIFLLVGLLCPFQSVKYSCV